VWSGALVADGVPGIAAALYDAGLRVAPSAPGASLDVAQIAAALDAEDLLDVALHDAGSGATSDRPSMASSWIGPTT